MFPTDRWKWSSKDGTKKTPKDSFHLPEHWQWENDWYIDQTIPGDEKVMVLYSDSSKSKYYVPMNHKCFPFGEFQKASLQLV